MTAILKIIDMATVIHDLIILLQEVPHLHVHPLDRQEDLLMGITVLALLRPILIVQDVLPRLQVVVAVEVQVEEILMIIDLTMGLLVIHLTLLIEAAVEVAALLVVLTHHTLQEDIMADLLHIPHPMEVADMELLLDIVVESPQLDLPYHHNRSSHNNHNHNSSSNLKECLSKDRYIRLQPLLHLIHPNNLAIILLNKGLPLRQQTLSLIKQCPRQVQSLVLYKRL